MSQQPVWITGLSSSEQYELRLEDDMAEGALQMQPGAHAWECNLHHPGGFDLIKVLKKKTSPPAVRGP